MFGAGLLATVVTYARLPAGSTYHFDDSGPSGAFSRATTYLNFPVALAAIALLGAARRDWLAYLAMAFCAVAAFPGWSEHLT